MSDVIAAPDGRQIEVREPTPLERIRFIRMLGKAADSQTYLGQAIIAAAARGIDGVPVMLPATVDQSDQLIAKLDGALEAIGEAILAARERRALNADAAKN